MIKLHNLQILQIRVSPHLRQMFWTLSITIDSGRYILFIIIISYYFNLKKKDKIWIDLFVSSKNFQLVGMIGYKPTYLFPQRFPNCSNIQDRCKNDVNHYFLKIIVHGVIYFYRGTKYEIHLFCVITIVLTVFALRNIVIARC